MKFYWRKKQRNKKYLGNNIGTLETESRDYSDQFIINCRKSMQHKIFSATNDVVFKKIFGDMNNEEVIKGFLSSILNIPKEEYELLKIESPFLNISDSATDKIGILDVKLSTKNKKIIDIEIV